MLMNSSKMIFISIMVTSTMMMFSSSMFLFSWMSMEINLIVIMPLICKSKKMKDQSMKYFIIQSLSSSMLLISMILNFLIESPVNFEKLTLISLMMKTGMLPFDKWVPMILQKLNWNMCFIMNTWQKISPTIVFCQVINFKTLILPLSLSLIFAPISLMKLLSMKKILAYSSIYNYPWMILSIYLSKSMFLLFFSIYSMMNFILMKKMKNLNINFMNQVLNKNLLFKFSILINLLSMSGLPPMMGFFPKWMILNMTMNISLMLTIMMIFSSLISTFIYMKIASSILMNQSTKKKFFKTKFLNDKDLLLNSLGSLMFFILKPN
uniref:NADH dehydrogenase subunit 2 n=1 Tax=Augilodes binghami TaxID=2886263 RepID=UPI001E72594B|nr:NADH dehydrogenase subunit 2 [Augilodes binghami]UDL72045.1 NADH dehydrogenase subunit 2 [Augilodes binghami]